MTLTQFCTLSPQAWLRAVVRAYIEKTDCSIHAELCALSPRQ